MWPWWDAVVSRSISSPNIFQGCALLHHFTAATLIFWEAVKTHRFNFLTLSSATKEMIGFVRSSTFLFLFFMSRPVLCCCAPTADLGCWDKRHKRSLSWSCVLSLKRALNRLSQDARALWPIAALTAMFEVHLLTSTNFAILLRHKDRFSLQASWWALAHNDRRKNSSLCHLHFTPSCW